MLWLSRADPQTRKICSTVNGPLLEMLAQSIGYRDASCIDLLRDGAPIIGRLPRFGGAGALLEDAQDVDTGAFWRDAIGNSNEKILQRLREDEHAAKLHKACVEDAEQGRMTNPVLLRAEHCCELVLSPRSPRFLQQFSPVVADACLAQGSQWSRACLRMGRPKCAPSTI